MFAQERHNAIRKIVREHRRMDFIELQRRVKVSPATLRRDLAELELAGDLIRVHGGVLDPGYARAEVSFDERILKNSAAKRVIADKAARLIPAGATVYVDAGSTCLEAGRALLGRKDIRIITHSVALVTAGLHGEAEVLCTGGELRKVSGALTGAGAMGSLGLLKADFAFLGASGLSEEGCSTTEVSEAEMKKAIILRSARKIILADSSKWGTSSTIRFAEWKDLTDWVGEATVPAKVSKFLRGCKVRVH